MQLWNVWHTYPIGYGRCGINCDLPCYLVVHCTTVSVGDHVISRTEQGGGCVCSAREIIGSVSRIHKQEKLGAAVYCVPRNTGGGLDDRRDPSATLRWRLVHSVSLSLVV